MNTLGGRWQRMVMGVVLVGGWLLASPRVSAQTLDLVPSVAEAYAESSRAVEGSPQDVHARYLRDSLAILLQQLFTQLTQLPAETPTVIRDPITGNTTVSMLGLIPPEILNNPEAFEAWVQHLHAKLGLPKNEASGSKNIPFIFFGDEKLTKGYLVENPLATFDYLFDCQDQGADPSGSSGSSSSGNPLSCSAWGGTVGLVFVNGGAAIQYQAYISRN